jgi:hypothetical protein
MFLGGCQDALDRRRRPQKDRLPPGLLGQTQEIHDAGDVDALAQSRGNDSSCFAQCGLLPETQAPDLTGVQPAGSSDSRLCLQIKYLSRC